MQGSFNTHLIALSCLAFVVAAAFLIFDLDEKLYPNSNNEYAATIDYTETPNHTIIAEPAPVISSSEQLVTQKQTPETKPLQKITPRVESEPKSRLFELENKKFSLDASGDAYLGTSGVSKKASLTLKLMPIKGTLLQEFQISDARLFLDGSGIGIVGVGAKTDNTKLTLEFLSETIGKFTIDVILDEKLLDDTNNKQSILIEDQKFYLVNKEVPYRLQMSGTLG